MEKRFFRMLQKVRDVFLVFVSVAIQHIIKLLTLTSFCLTMRQTLKSLVSALIDATICNHFCVAIGRLGS